MLCCVLSLHLICGGDREGLDPGESGASSTIMLQLLWTFLPSLVVALTFGKGEAPLQNASAFALNLRASRVGRRHYQVACLHVQTN